MQGVAKVNRGDGNVSLIEIREPVVLPHHVLIEVAAAGVCGTDLHIYHDEYPSDPPVILGHELAGTVALVGEGVTTCTPGDRVTSETYFYVCGRCRFCRDGSVNLCPERKSIGSGANGAMARYVLVPEHSIHHLPGALPLMAGALTEPLACTVHALEQTRVEPGDVAIVSGPGAIGLLMAQVAKAAGATVIVLGTSIDKARLDLAVQLGMDLSLDVQRANPVEAVLEQTSGFGADVVFECAGAAASARTCLELVRRKGRYAQVGLFGHPIEWNCEQVIFKELHVTGSFATVPSSWRRALALMASGQVQTQPLISHILPLTDWQRAFEISERRQGLKVVLTP